MSARSPLHRRLRRQPTSRCSPKFAICSPGADHGQHCWTKTPVVGGRGFLFSHLVRTADENRRPKTDPPMTLIDSLRTEARAAPESGIVA
ncbi:hypothetical protein ENZ75_24595, partial [Mesorhizobium sp. M7A.F.Ca.CA.002.04.1.1]